MLLFFGDIFITLAAGTFAFFTRFDLTQALDDTAMVTHELNHYSVHILFGAFVMGSLLYASGMYHMNLLTRYRYGALKMLTCCVYWGISFLAISLIFKIDPAISRLWVIYTMTFAMAGLTTWRFLFCRHLLGTDRLQSLRRRTLIIGWNDQASDLLGKSQLSDSGKEFFPFTIRGAITMDPSPPSDLPPAEINRGVGAKELRKQLATGRYDTVVLATSSLSLDETILVQEMCGLEMIDFMMIPDFVRTLTSCLHIESFQGVPLLTQTKRELDKTSSILTKRVFDIAGALVGLFFSAPLIAYFTWRVYRESPGPVFYNQTRLGKDGKPFKIIKIRSMRLDAEAQSGAKWCTEDDPRRLEIGAFIRKYNIDELPQFWNVLRGEMSLVGPRPERPELIKDFKHEIGYYNLRHTVKPGITGWAQVNGWRGDTSLESRIACDIEYIERWNPWFDVYICLKTFSATKNAY